MSAQSHHRHAAERSPVETLTDMIMAYRLSQLIYVAARLGIADFLKDGPKMSAELAMLTSVDPHPTHTSRAKPIQGGTGKK